MPETCQIGNFLSGIVWHFVQGLSKELWAGLACRWLSSVAATLTKMAPLAAWMSSMLSPVQGRGLGDLMRDDQAGRQRCVVHHLAPLPL